MDGLQENGYMVTACKHFPGQGIDERNSHCCTTSKRANHFSFLSKELLLKRAILFTFFTCFFLIKAIFSYVFYLLEFYS